MSITSITFLFHFLPIFLLLYLLIPFRGARNVFLLLASLLFYAWGELSYTLVLLLSILVNYGVGALISRTQGRTRRGALAAGILANLGLLAVFKYTKLIVSAVQPLLEAAGISVEVGTIHLPIGISFFTFKAIAYLVDLHRRHAEFERNPIGFATYLCMFPQLLAGPIMRYPEAQQQLRARHVTLSGFRLGVEEFIVGIGQKMLIANTLASPAEAIFALPPGSLSTGVAWLGAFCYTLQIYFDFSGYTNMAIGIGRMMGFTFPANFNYPYIAESVTDFWKRWHITLSTWFRDYLWFPLGSTRRGRLRAYINLLTVFSLCGLWHGAGWTFIAWGFLHGAALAAERAGGLLVLARLPRPFRTCYALLIVTGGWVLFRSGSIGAASRYLWSMVRLSGGDGIHSIGQYLPPEAILALTGGVLFSAPWGNLLKRGLRRWDRCQLCCGPPACWSS
jgi:alginate O-acetyltransferase complex protein AlgI